MEDQDTFDPKDPDKSGLKDKHETDLRGTARGIAYERACSNYEAIAEFRAKLLALLPLATGTGAFLLLQKQDTTPQIRQLLGPIGLLGFIVTGGLFTYELRGMQRCSRLEIQASLLEQDLRLGREAPFTGEPRRAWKGMFGPPAAGLIIYISTAFTWLFVAGVGFGLWSIPTSPTPTVPQPSPDRALWLLLVYVVVLVGLSILVRWWLERAAKGEPAKIGYLDQSGPDSQSSGAEDSTRAEAKAESLLSKDSLLAALLQRHQEDETILWQGPALALAAQAFLLTIALAKDTSTTGRVIATLLAVVTALMSIYLVLRKRQELDGVVQ